MTHTLFRGALTAAAILTAASAAQAAGFAFGQPGKAADASRTVEVVMQDNWFEPESIAVKPGETVRFVIRNDGASLHQFHLGTAAMLAEEQKHMALMQDHGMVGQHGMNHDMMKMDHAGTQMPAMDHDAPNSVLVEPGKTAEIVWTFTDATGVEFSCGMPGHYEAGMTGPVTVAP